ncbi:MAG: hypothetical protein LIQ30_02915 [Planctomycetes bacterium]|nr:hypothetical protein [Planctomycetota bacterium]MCC8116575.1 hypothetical protein [Planctomycetota bacterium]
MSGLRQLVKFLPVFLAVMVFHAAATTAGDQPVPHMMYFYNPSCRLCTKTNEVVAAAEEAYKDRLTFQRFNIADSEHGTDNVLYMFDLLDALEVPDEGNITLVVFLGTLETDDSGEPAFAPYRVLVEGENIIPKLDAEIRDFLEKDMKGGAPLGFVPPAGFFRHGRAA